MDQPVAQSASSRGLKIGEPFLVVAVKRCTMINPIRRLVVVLGDQLDESSRAFEGFQADSDCIWMAEVRDESTRIPISKARIVMFLAAMRHFRNSLRSRGWRVEYSELTDSGREATLSSELSRFVALHRPREIVCVEPGEWRLREELGRELWAVGKEGWLEDDHFLCSHSEFEAHAAGRRQLRMEFFYREMRRRKGVLMDGTSPAGGEWNFDAENRGTFGKDGPVFLPPPVRFKPDEITSEVITMVCAEFPEAPGEVSHFDFPVTRAEALVALEDFIKNRLPLFGRYQDAMWSGEPWLYHARLSAALNLKLLRPWEVIVSAEKAWREGHASIESVEGFIRQILGWREYVRGVYWLFMPRYLDGNALDATHSLPSFYWNGQTEMSCLRETIQQTLKYGYAHHIQRLMVTGLYALLLGVSPKQVHEWYLSVYLDAVEWVELPNTLGMSQYADGGVMASKPYVATGKYIQRMSNYCKGCRYDPGKAVGGEACPFTTLYWDFLSRNRGKLQKNQRMSLQLKNLDRISSATLEAIRERADEIKGWV